MKKIIFCNIDGVLNRQYFGEDEQSKFGFDKNCVNSLKYILTCVPDAKIVITSAWKRFDIEPHVSKTIPWRKVLETQLNKPNVIIGDTPCLDGTISKSSDTYTRASDIDAYLKEHASTIEKFVILDDEVSCYKETWLESHVVDCEIKTGRGLDAVNACHAVRILKGTIGPKSDEPIDESCKQAKDSDEFVPNICYQSLFDDARNMAATLKKIDQELTDAAQCEGDYPGGYPTDRLLPNLCKIMYANLGNFNDERYN